VPLEVIAKYRKAADDMDGTRRDLISGCFLDKKIGGVLYFSHRSVQEFLVAECIYRDLCAGSANIEAVDAAVTPEVGGFLEELIGSRALGALADLISKHRGGIGSCVAGIWFKTALGAEHAKQKARATEVPWFALFLILAARHRPQDRSLGKETRAILVDRVSQAISDEYAAFVCFVSLLLPRPGDCGEILLSLARRVIAARQTTDVKASLRLLSTVTLGKAGEISLSGVGRWGHEAFSHYCHITDWRRGSTFSGSEFGLPGSIEVPVKTWNELLGLLGRLQRPSGT
jgi:hypothetical protein